MSTKQSEVITFGCRLNIFESEIIKNNLTSVNLDNVVVFNTCTVTQSAEKQAIKIIRKTKKNNPDVKIIVTGCAAQNNPDLFANMPEVDKVIGNNEKLSPSYYKLHDEKIVVNDIMQIKETANHFVSSFDGKSRAFLQIQNGCDHRCTFCIIPFVRGNNRSVPVGVMVEQIRKLVKSGYSEIVFTGVDITGYGTDLPGTPTLAQLIKRVLNLVPELQRLRLSSIDVAEIDDELFELMAYSPRLMPHFHISVQAGDDMILKRMKRRHTRKQVIDFCNKLRKLRRDVSFGADIITGFPTETEAMFNNTKELIVEADLQYLHIFPYSQRDGTPAARMPQVENDVIKYRAAILRDQGKNQLHSFYTRYLGKNVKILCENNRMAHTENFIPVKLTREYPVGDIVEIQLKAIDGDLMLA